MSDTLVCASEPYLSHHETSFNSEEAYPQTESATLDTHASACHMVDDQSKQYPPPNNAKSSISSHSTTQAVNAGRGDNIPLAHRALQNHGKSSHKDKTVQYMRSPHHTYGSISASNDHTTIPHYPYPTFIHEADLEQPAVQVQAQVEPLYLTQVLGQGPASWGYDFIGIGAQFSR